MRQTVPTGCNPDHRPPYESGIVWARAASTARETLGMLKTGMLPSLSVDEEVHHNGTWWAKWHTPATEEGRIG